MMILRIGAARLFAVFVSIGPKRGTLEQVEGSQRLRRHLMVSREWRRAVDDAQQHGFDGSVQIIGEPFGLLPAARQPSCGMFRPGSEKQPKTAEDVSTLDLLRRERRGPGPSILFTGVRSSAMGTGAR